MEFKPAARARDGIRPPELFNASDLARFCQVDLKTIHNWADKGELPHFRTPGRHLRFRRLDVLEFLRKYTYAIPDVLRHGKPRLVLVDGDAAVLTAVRRALSKRFEVVTFQDPLDALIALSGVQPDGLVMDVELPGFDGLRFLARLRTLDATSHIRVIVFTARDDLREPALRSGAVEVVSKGDTARLREVLEKLMGLER